MSEISFEDEVSIYLFGEYFIDLDPLRAEKIINIYQIAEKHFINKNAIPLMKGIMNS